jgi:hypothetical protein
MSMALVSTLCTLPAQALLFRSITVQSLKGCCALLQALMHNPRLGTFIKHVTIQHDQNYSEPVESQWYHTAPAGKLFVLLINVEAIQLAGMGIDHEEIERLIQSLNGPLRSVTELILSNTYITGLHQWTRLVLHFSNLDTIDCRRSCKINVAWNDPSASGWITAPNSRTVSTSWPGRLRRMRLGFEQNNAKEVNDTWLAQSSFTSNLEELDLSHSSSQLFGTLWGLTLCAAHTLKALSICAPQPTAKYPSLDLLPMLNAHQLSYLRLWDRSNNMSLDSVTAVLAVISPSLSLRRLVLDEIRVIDADENPHDMALWTKLDEVVTHNFRALQEVIIHVVFGESGDIQESDPLISSNSRLAMPELHNSGILQLSIKHIPSRSPRYREPEPSFFT